MDSFNPTEKTTLKRMPERGSYDRQTAYQILDEGLICHVGFTVEGQPYVIPTAYARIEDRLLIHGSVASRMLRSLQEGIDVCINVTLLDSLVLARSAFSHSMNYRSVMIFGKASLIEDKEEKTEALRALTEHIVPGRWPHVRQPNLAELNRTSMLLLPLEEVSIKMRLGPPGEDDERDYDFPVWAGEIPLNIVPGDPIDDPRLLAGMEVPDYVKNYTHPSQKSRKQ